MHGGYGEVRRGTWNGRAIVLKVPVRNIVRKQAALATEASFLATLTGHENIISLLGVCNDVPDHGTGIVLELADGDTSQLIKALGPVPGVQRAPAWQVARDQMVDAELNDVTSTATISNFHAHVQADAVQHAPVAHDNADAVILRAEYAICIGFGVARALAHMHSTAFPDTSEVMVHRDIKRPISSFVFPMAHRYHRCVEI